MNKYIITTAIAFTAITGVFAEGQDIKRTSGATTKAAMVRPAMPAIMNGQPSIITGDAVTDAKVKALQAEMEEKIQAIRVEYLAKIKAIIGDKKVKTTGVKMMENGTMPKKMEGQKGTGEGEAQSGETTEPNMADRQKRMDMKKNEGGRPSIIRDEKKIPTEGQVQGESTGGVEVQVPAAPSSGVRGFFGRLFGR